MALQTQLHMVFGFSREVEWRPLRFVEPIPGHRICDACGLLPRTTVFLPCRHVLCKTCYGQCLVDNGYECPVDEEQFRKEDADWREFPVDNLLMRKVRCWNEDSGCEAVMSASEIFKHFNDDCLYHSTRCPKCSALVLRRNVCAHRKSKCSAHVLPNQAQQLKASPDSFQEAMFSDLKKTLEEHVEEMRYGIDQLVRDNNTHSNRLNEVSHFVNALRETLIETSQKQTRDTNEARIATVREVKEDLAAKGDRLDEVAQRIGALTEEVKVISTDADATRQCIENLERSNAELRRRFATDDSALQRVSETVRSFECVLDKALERATEVIVQKFKPNAVSCTASNALERENGQDASDVKESQLLAKNTLGITQNVFCVKHVKALKENATSSGSDIYERDPVYLCGYRISPGLYLKKNENSVSVHAYIRLHKGVLDEFLQWPFSHNVNVSFMHSSPGKNRELVLPTTFNINAFGRPTKSHNESFYWYASLPLEDLESEGHLESGQLCIKYKLLPPTTK